MHPVCGQAVPSVPTSLRAGFLSTTQKSGNSGGSALFGIIIIKKRQKSEVPEHDLGAVGLSMAGERVVRPTEPAFWDSESYFLGCGGRCWVLEVREAQVWVKSAGPLSALKLGW